MLAPSRPLANTGELMALPPPPGDMVMGHPLSRVEDVSGRGGGTTASELKPPPPAAPVKSTEEEIASALVNARAAASRTVRSAQCRAAATSRATSGCKSPPYT